MELQITPATLTDPSVRAQGYRSSTPQARGAPGHQPLHPFPACPSLLGALMA